MSAKHFILGAILGVILLVVLVVCGFWAWAIVTRGKYM
jgi:hypothetical protein